MLEIAQVATLPISEQLQNSLVGRAVGGLDPAFGIIAQLLHIAGLLFLLTPLLLVNLRLLNKGLILLSLPELAQTASRLQWLGLLLLTISGVFMWLPSAALYAPNPAFLLKFILLAAALLLHFSWYRLVVRRGDAELWQRLLLVAASFILWFGVGLAGRAVGFVAA